MTRVPVAVLRERLIDLERDRCAGAQRTIDEVSGDQLLREVQRHDAAPINNVRPYASICAVLLLDARRAGMGWIPKRVDLS
jgi:hypothetical protein